MGVIDALLENTFSADINGDLPVVAYQCGIFKNNATSDLVYDTGVVELTTPAYGADANGNIIPFTYTIPANMRAMDYYTTNVTYSEGVYSLTYDAFEYTSGMVVGFLVPSAVGDVESVSVSAGGHVFTMSALPNWVANAIVFVQLNGSNTYSAVEQRYPYTAMDNGYIYGYKYILTLWSNYDSSNVNDNCVESYEYVFYAKATPSVTIDAFADSYVENVPVIASRTGIWSASYVQSDNAGITWFQWTLALSADRTKIVDQTRKVYSNSALSYTFDGLSTGVGYSVKVEVQTYDGVTVNSGWVDFSVSYPTIQISSAVQINPTNDCGVQIDWGNLQYIEGAPNNSSYRYLKYLPANRHTCVELLGGNNITFTSSAHFDLNIPLDATQVWSGFIEEDNASIYYASGVDADGNNIYMNLSHEGSESGLCPTTSLTPTATLTPHDGVGGYFVLDINNEYEFSFASDYISLNWFIVRMSMDGMHVTQVPYILDRSQLIIVNP